jgi:hypothetical protein
MPTIPANDEPLDAPAVCELCDRESEAGTHEAAIAAGWAYTWDGWLCPKHNKELSE